jgi:hypothetical protein
MDNEIDDNNSKNIGNIDLSIKNSITIEYPLELLWLPKPDITAFELACCLPYFNNHRIYSEEVFDTDGKISEALKFLRHFRIINHNKKI